MESSTETAVKHHGNRRVLRTVITVLVAVLVVASSLGAYLFERARSQNQVTFGDVVNIDRVDVVVYVKKVDPVAQELAAQVQVMPQGRYADEVGFPKEDLTLYLNATKGDTLQFKAGKNPAVQEVRIPLSTGVITDYPFDAYTAELGFYAETPRGPAPIAVHLGNADSFFALTAGDPRQAESSLEFDVDISRTAGMFAFAIFIMIFMWCLSISALIAARYVIRGKLGLLWPSMSFMGALLFALVPLRNAVPGAPPIGSVIDFCAFFIAEAIISISLICMVVFGYRIERRKAAKSAA